MIEKLVPFCVKPVFGLCNKWHNIKLFCRVTRHISNCLLFIFKCWEEFSLNCILRNSTLCIIYTIFSLPECGRILVKYSFLVEFGGQIYFSDRDLVVLSNLPQRPSTSQPSAFAFSENSFAPRAPRLWACWSAPSDCLAVLFLGNAIRSADAKLCRKWTSWDFRYWRELEKLAAHCAVLVQGQLDKVSRDVKSSHCLVCQRVL